MEDFGNWIYVIIIVGIALINMFKGATKEKKPEMKIPDEWFSPEEEYQREPEKDPIPVRRKSVKQEVQVKPQEVRYPTVSSVSDHMKQHVQIEEMEEEEGMAELDFDNPDELRKGIIYTEIFGRKYS